MSSKFLANIGLNNDLLPDGMKPLPEPMLTYHQWGSVAFPQIATPRKVSNNI